MTDVVRDPLWRLVELEQRQRQRSSTQAPAQPASPPGRRRLGYSPSLDGLRAISVVAVILYHAGFSWTKGGFYGVEVFFVVSGFLITSLLLEEREVDGGVSLRAFWIRRARRLLPALFTMLLAVSVWARLFGTAEQQNQLRRDLPWSIFYVANWGQVFSKAAYYSPVDPPLLRHMWSLAVEEQWYLVWPMVFIGLVALGWSRRTRGAVLVGVFATLWLWMWWLTRPGLAAPMKVPDPFHGGTATVDRANALYLSTFTRAGGLLLGAGVAHLWRPWRRTRPVDRTRAQVIEAYGLGALVGLIIVFARADLAAAYTFQWLLPIVSLLSVIVVATAVHPQSVVVRRLLSWQPLVVVGRRSYGLYLWHWPIFVFLAVENGGGVRLVAALVLTVAVSELCYRFVETPVRKGAIGDLVARLRADRANGPTATSRRTGVAVAGSMVLIGALVVSYVSLQPFDRAAGGADTGFVLPPNNAAAANAQPGVTTKAATGAGGAAAATGSSAPGAAASRPRRVVLVGDSTAHALAINLPSGIGSTFKIADGSIDGCSIFDAGTVTSTEGYTRNLSCKGWAQQWAKSATSSNAQLAVVVIGAWDVLDLTLDGTTYAVGTPQHDELFQAHLQSGIDALSAAGSHVVLLQIPCMRPQAAKGQGTPPLPERGDDRLVAHLNGLMQRMAASEPDVATYVNGPAAWCDDPAIASSLAYRWDGVHVYKPGAKLIYETIAPSLLAIGG